MLLPSALPCDAFSALQKPQRPRLPLLCPYTPTPQTASSGLLASCRALQGIIGARTAPQPAAGQTHGVRGSPLQPRAHNSRVFKRSPLKPAPPRGANKRRRDEFEASDSDTAVEDYEKENDCNVEHPAFSTPKRQRRIPLAMPLGLSARDFYDLRPAAATARQSDHVLVVDVPEPRQQRDGFDYATPDAEWTVNDDRMLVETVLNKLNLSKREWNDCARRLGKDKDSLGRRWKALVGDGNVGLRRGTGRMERTDLDIRSW